MARTNTPLVDSTNTGQHNSSHGSHSRAKDARKKASKHKKHNHSKTNRTVERVPQQQQDDEDVEMCIAETSRERELRDEIAHLRAERDAALRNNEPTASTIPDGSIPRPRNMKTVNISSIREQLDLAGDEHRFEWRDIRNDVRTFMKAGLLNDSLDFKSQDTKKLANIYNAIEEKHPSLRRFTGQWAIQYVVKEVWNNRHSFLHTRDRTDTYRGRERMQRDSGRRQRLQGKMDALGSDSNSGSEDSDSSSSSSSSGSDDDDGNVDGGGGENERAGSSSAPVDRRTGLRSAAS